MNLLAVWLCFAAPLLAEEEPEKVQEAPSVDQLLAAVDRNMTFEKRKTELRMTVDKGRRTKVYEMESHARGRHEAAIEFNAPAREKGTKMLKGKDELWIYMPAIEKTQKISGHMLRQGMMGSDLSYEDILQATSLTEVYNATVAGEEQISGRPCYRIEMQARNDEVSYPKRISWIDREHMVPVREELYALSGMMLKSWEMSEVKDFQGRAFPTRIVVEDQLQAGSKTTLEFLDIDFTVALEEEIFSKRWLER
jgi:outer membrane lipoprotein-sorting protein